MKNNNFKKTLIAGSLLAALYVTPTLAADNFSGSIKGHVIAGANATVTIKHNEKGIVRTVTADDKGEYSLRKLPVGEYTLTISKLGFEPEIIENLLVTLGGQELSSQLRTGSDVEVISVTGTRQALVDMSTSTSGIVITAQDMARLPIDTSFNSVVLLAPSANATSGSNFGRSPNIGGSSSAENGYYLNGVNITNIRTGLGVVDIPFAAVNQTAVLTGGIAPEFGNALGGIVNAVTKSGTNDFEFGVLLRHDNESLRSRHNDILNRDGSVSNNLSGDKSDFTRVSLTASGPIIKDTLFFYAMYAPQEDSYWNAGTSTVSVGKETSDRYMGKVDWYINDEHSLEFTYINFENEDEWDTHAYDIDKHQKLAQTGKGKATDGGSVAGIKYTGLLSDNVSLDVIAGRVTEIDESDADNDLPGVWSRWGSKTGQSISQHSSSTVTDSEFTRDQLRADLMWDLDEHQLKFGFDFYDTHVDYTSIQNGTGEGGTGSRGWWDLLVATEGNAAVVGVDAGENYIKQRIRNDFSDSHVKSQAFYVQDSWQATDNLVLNLGVRLENFSNELSTGSAYAEVKNQIAPRLQAMYDLTGDGSSKVFATFGRYFQPISANMNITQGGSRHDEHWYFAADQVDADGQAVLGADGSPSRGAQTGYLLAQDSALVSPTSVAHNDLDAMYSDEITLGFETEVFDGDMKASVRLIHRELKSSIEDADLGQVIGDWYEAQGLSRGGSWVVFNPGEGLNVKGDFNSDGNVDHIVLSAEEMGMPEPKREYAAMEFTLKGKATEDLFIDATYTWSHLWGNTAGLVNQNDNQADPGWTVSYDYAGLQDHATGNLPSDRRHVFKLNGYYNLTDDLVLGLVSSMSTGTPINYMGIHPGGVDSCAPGKPWADCPSRTERGNGSAFYDEDGNPRPRGSAGTTEFFTNMDMSLTYTMEMNGNPLQFKGIVYNLFNSDTAVGVNHTGTIGDGTVHNPNWRRATSLQSHRYVSLSVSYQF